MLGDPGGGGVWGFGHTLPASVLSTVFTALRIPAAAGAQCNGAWAFGHLVEHFHLQHLQRDDPDGHVCGVFE